MRIPTPKAKKKAQTTRVAITLSRAPGGSGHQAVLFQGILCCCTPRTHSACLKIFCSCNVQHVAELHNFHLVRTLCRFPTSFVSDVCIQTTTAMMKAKVSHLMGNSTRSMRMSSSMAAWMRPIQLNGFWALSSTCCLEDAKGLALSGLAPAGEAMETSRDRDLAVPWPKDSASVGEDLDKEIWPCPVGKLLLV